MIIRKLELKDLGMESFFQTLSNLRPINSKFFNLAEKIFNECEEKGIEMYVVEYESLIIGTIRILFEPKFYHEGRAVMHIEDVSTHKNYEGIGVSSLLVNYVLNLAKERNCYKVILNCSENLIDYYKKFNFSLSGACMRLDL